MKKRPEIHTLTQQNRDNFLALLTKLVNQNSFSRNPEGVNLTGEIIRQAMPPGFKYEFQTNRLGVKHHTFSQLQDQRPAIVLAGHIDTLCPLDPSFDRLFDEGETLRGPGVNDMKGGDVVLIGALQILHQCNLLSDLPLICVFNGDEELGSPTSYPIFTDLKNRAALALVFECGGPADTVVTTRKGIMRYRLHIKGKPNHFGNLREIKVSAIEELAHKILTVEAFNKPDGSVAANVGKIEGGIAANAVAPAASMDFEVRYWDPKLEKKILPAIEALTSDIKVNGCAVTLQRLSYRPAMQPTPESMRIFDLIVKRGQTLGMNITEEKRGGVSDACWLAHVGIPVIDGLGPLGDHDFTPAEYITKETLFSRIELTANLLLDFIDAGLA